MANEQQFNNDTLISALANFKADQSQANQQAFELALLQASFLVPVQIPDETKIDEQGGIAVESGEEIRLLTFMDNDQQQVFPVFTDEKNFQANPDGWAEDTRVITIPFGDFMTMFEKDEALGALAMNPFNEDEGMPISRQNMTYLAQAYTQIESGEAKVEAERQEAQELTMEITVPEDVPTPLQYELIGIADDAMGKITEMYLLWLTEQQSQAGRFFLVIDGPDVEQLNDFVPVFRNALKKVLGEQVTPEVVPMARLDGVDLSEFKTFYARNI
ncbi:SseB family protein [Weissella diestrammenae]|uniref:SseB family protein n=1 Tax=Weissella diestrammenae TaxID=1162633 RepID=A0A7G9T6K3_9LACO|nr:SseB family protein [Weissella diestrammenae]MCM0582994.1 SseB family protein [Weissella diestrammenae]QNN75728.1 SseB family protein [Weissella diestrammenae]